MWHPLSSKNLCCKNCRMELPANTSDRLRPLGAPIFSHFKHFTVKEIDDRVVSVISLLPGKYTVTRKNFWKAILNRQEDSATVSNCKSGFRRTGLCHLNRQCLCENGIRESRTWPRVLTTSEFKRSFRNVFFTCKRFGLWDVRIDCNFSYQEWYWAYKE